MSVTGHELSFKEGRSFHGDALRAKEALRRQYDSSQESGRTTSGGGSRA
jgi:hypothetical protein